MKEKTVSELKELCKKNNIKNFSKLKKNELIKLLNKKNIKGGGLFNRETKRSFDEKIKYIHLQITRAKDLEIDLSSMDIRLKHMLYYLEKYNNKNFYLYSDSKKTFSKHDLLYDGWRIHPKYGRNQKKYMKKKISIVTKTIGDRLNIFVLV